MAFSADSPLLFKFMSRRNIIVFVVIAVIIIAAAVYSLQRFHLISPQHVTQSGVQTALAEIGSVMTTVDAEGIVAPEIPEW